MFRLSASTQAHLTPEACAVAEAFLAALPPYATRTVQAVRLFGPQARRFDPDAAFDFLVLADARTPELRSAAALSSVAAELGGLYRAVVTIATPLDVEQPAPVMARLLKNARREGIDLWVRPPVPPTAG